MKQYIRHQHKHHTERLHADAQVLITRMRTLMETIERGGSINSLGEIQGMALDIDRRCAQIGILRELLDFQET